MLSGGDAGGSVLKAFDLAADGLEQPDFRLGGMLRSERSGSAFQNAAELEQALKILPDRGYSKPRGPEFCLNHIAVLPRFR